MNEVLFATDMLQSQLSFLNQLHSSLHSLEVTLFHTQTVPVMNEVNVRLVITYYASQKLRTVWCTKVQTLLSEESDGNRLTTWSVQ